ncbi:major facilitator superfamily domain-containing protein [Aspergillus karnatakaensis]|uniref:major facilitator superfamily domain-containing protein n=1 Tax=Aspergillus karnatakaensis TaxID=1810916 RepID=UPI003CCCF319
MAYTTFSHNQKYYFTYLLGYLTLASSLTATIYFPLIDLLSHQYNVSSQLINLTITVYVIFQAISPAFWGPLSDTLGRRPVFLITFSLYKAASLGLALNESNYAGLAVLRGLQSIGGSAVMSLAYAVVADISPRSDRGKILGPMLAATNLGPCVGPVIGGGAILASGDPLWCFWALLIFGGSSVLLIGWTLPETARVVVVWYCIQTSIPSIFDKDIYGYNDLIVGLCYLPGGFGVIVGGLMDWNYKHTALQHGLAPSTTTNPSMGTSTDKNTTAEEEPRAFFPYEIARSRGSYTILTVSTFIIVGYGWAVKHHAHPSIPLMLQVLIGAKCTVILQTFSALLVDIFPRLPGTAAAVAALEPLSGAVGRAWLFTLLALVDGGMGLVAVWVLRRWGGVWRVRRETGLREAC